MKRVRIEEFFRDFDKLRKGKVTIPQFKQILSMLNFNLTEEEFGSLADKYRTSDPEGTFNYFAFCNNINTAFTQKGIDKNPTHTVKPITSDDTLLARRKYLEGMSEEDQQVQQIVAEYRKAIINKRLNLKPMFQDFDITKNSHVSKIQFMRVLTQLGIMAPDHVMNLLLKRYMDMGNLDEVNYVDFCKEIDRPEDIFGVGLDYN
jgi:Ca2+-binding EF-hand superfamily protein